MKSPARALAGILVLLLLSALPALAAVTVVAHYGLGESDPGAAAGATGDDPTVDSVAGLNLTRFGSPTYSGNVPFSIGSTLSMAFNGTNENYAAGTNPTVVTDNFGIEAWFLWNGNAASNGAIAYNGNTGSSGWGVYRFGSNAGFLMGGVVVVTGPPMPAGRWVEIALVRTSGTNTLYLDGGAKLTTADVPNAPTTAGGGGMLIAANQAATELFDGNIDEVRVFTFAPGAFTTADLNLPTAGIPAAGTAALIAMALLLAGAAALTLRK